MSVVNNQPANATIFNGAFLSRTTNTSTVGRLTLNNTSIVESGAMITNVQRYINELADIAGVSSEGDATAFIYATEWVIANGMDRKEALEALDGAFDPATGHNHDGVDSAPISASVLDDINYFSAEWQNFVLLAAAGTNDTITTQMSGKLPGGTDTTTGVATASPNNRCEIVDANSLASILDGSNRRVYGRIFESGGVWTINYYVLISGVETAHNLTPATDILVTYREVFTLETIPTFSQNVGVLGSYDISGDIDYATNLVAGKVLLATFTPLDVADVAALGVSTAVALEDHVHAGLHSIAIDGEVDPPILGDFIFEAGSGISLSYRPQGIVIESTGGSGGVLVDYFTLDAGMISAKEVTLSVEPTQPTQVRLDVIGGGAQVYSVDFTVTADVLSWDTLGLDGFLAIGDKLRVVYSAGEVVEYRTLSGGEITAKELTLAAAPGSPAKVLVDIIGGSAQVYSFDFTVTGSDLEWASLGMDGLVIAGDILRISYSI